MSDLPRRDDVCSSPRAIDDPYTHVHALSYLNYSIISVRRYLIQRLLYSPPMASPRLRLWLQ